jgi:hypothetical protein
MSDEEDAEILEAWARENPEELLKLVTPEDLVKIRKIQALIPNIKSMPLKESIAAVDGVLRRWARAN